MQKVALITGASSGIGKELAFIHASKGGDLVLVARSGDKLELIKQQIEQKYSTNVYVIVKDLSVYDASTAVYQEIQEQGIEIEYLINNAGFGLLGRFDTLSWQRQQEMINLNMTALTQLTYLFLPAMVKRNSGKILNISSTASLIPGPLQAVYYASKAYVTSLGNALAEELHDTKITVTNVLPGATKTEFGAVSGMDKTDMFNKTATAYSVANDGYKAMLKGSLDVITGVRCTQRMMLALVAFMPKKMLLKTVRKMQEVNK